MYNETPHLEDQRQARSNTSNRHTPPSTSTLAASTLSTSSSAPGFKLASSYPSIRSQGQGDLSEPQASTSAQSYDVSDAVQSHHSSFLKGSEDIPAEGEETIEKYEDSLKQAPNVLEAFTECSTSGAAQGLHGNLNKLKAALLWLAEMRGDHPVFTKFPAAHEKVTVHGSLHSYY